MSGYSDQEIIDEQLAEHGEGYNKRLFVQQAYDREYARQLEGENKEAEKRARKKAGLVRQKTQVAVETCAHIGADPTSLSDEEMDTLFQIRRAGSQHNGAFGPGHAYKDPVAERLVVKGLLTVERYGKWFNHQLHTYLGPGSIYRVITSGGQGKTGKEAARITDSPKDSPSPGEAEIMGLVHGAADRAISNIKRTGDPYGEVTEYSDRHGEAFPESTRGQGRESWER